jgi:outer membrane protein
MGVPTLGRASYCRVGESTAGSWVFRVHRGNKLVSRQGSGARSAAVVVAAALASGLPCAASADTLDWALVQAYQNNPQLNSQRAALHSQDEAVPQALSGYRPNVAFAASVGSEYQSTLSKGVNPLTNAPIYTGNESTFTPHSVGIQATQILFNGYRTGNRTRQAEAQVSAGRATLAVTEQTVLLNAATAYMNLLRDAAILDLQRRNVEVLQEQLRQTRDRFNVGEVTRTDVAQAESRLAAGRAQVLAAESSYMTSRAQYRQTIGVDPGRLAAASPVDRFSPRTLPASISAGRANNPSVAAAMFGVDVALLQVKINEGALAPTLTATLAATQNWELDNTFLQQFSASATANLTVPIYQGGAEYSLVRQAKETVGQQRITVDTVRDQVQSSVQQAWGQLEAAKAQIQATTAQVNSAEIALNGVREEARVGQRTTLDVLNAQQELVNARVALVTAQHDRVVASYLLLQSVGGLTVQELRLKTNVYDPMVHYQQVRDVWGGLRTPDGR